MKEVLEVVQSLKSDMLFLKENMVSKEDLRQEIHASEKRIILGVCGFIEDNITPQLDSMNNRMGVMNQEIGVMSGRMDTMSGDIRLIKTALGRPILHT